MSAKHPSLNNHSLSVVLTSKNDVTRKEQLVQLEKQIITPMLFLQTSTVLWSVAEVL